jgi:hypothetical protein
MMICGLTIGGLAAFSFGKKSIAGVAIGAIACLYAYYVSQSSLAGSLLDSYGLVWLLLPVMIVVAIGAFNRFGRGEQATVKDFMRVK